MPPASPDSYYCTADICHFHKIDSHRNYYHKNSSLNPHRIRNYILRVELEICAVICGSQIHYVNVWEEICVHASK